MESLSITIFSPDNIYSYGAMVITDVCENAGYNVNLTRNPSIGEAKNSDIVCLSLSSTLHLVGKTVELINNLKNQNNSFIVVRGPVSIATELIFSYLLNNDAVVMMQWP